MGAKIMSVLNNDAWASRINQAIRNKRQGGPGEGDSIANVYLLGELMVCAGRAGIQEVPGFPVKTKDFGDTDRRLFDAARISALNERVDIS